MLILPLRIIVKHLRGPSSPTPPQKKPHQALLGSTHGCPTSLSLYYDTTQQVEWVVEKELLDLDQWTICAGCGDP